MVPNTIFTFFVTAIIAINGQCSDNETSIASVEFKDCMDQKQAALLQINLETDNNLSVFCDGLEDFNSGCQNVVDKFSQCKTRQYVENLVAIHIDSMAGEITNKNTTITSLLSIMLISCFRFVSPAEPRAGYEDLSCVCETNITPGGSSHWSQSHPATSHQQCSPGFLANCYFTGGHFNTLKCFHKLIFKNSQTSVPIICIYYLYLRECIYLFVNIILKSICPEDLNYDMFWSFSSQVLVHPHKLLSEHIMLVCDNNNLILTQEVTPYSTQCLLTQYFPFFL